ncbi:Uncharacterised protein [Neisseria gonorrhoeae]|nr:Uncharacterised protein [Neisseria gonorrhoeae]
MSPKSQKILFIVAESWGLPGNPELQNATFAKLLAQKDRFSVWESGSFPFIGATVEGEMRELCAYGRFARVRTAPRARRKICPLPPQPFETRRLRHLCDARRG